MALNYSVPQTMPGGGGGTPAPSSSSSATTYQPPSLEQLLGFTSSYGSPEQFLFDKQLGPLQQQDAASSFLTQLQQSNLQNQYSFDTTNLGLARQDLGLQRQQIPLNSRVPSLLDQLAQLRAQQQFQSLQPGFLRRDLNLSNQLVGVGRQQARSKYSTDVRSLLSDATARGAFNAPGTERSYADLGATLSQQLTGLDINRRQNVLGFQKGLANAQFDLGTTGREIAGTRRTTGTQRSLDVLANRQLDIEASKLGIKAQELQNGLNVALAQLGVNRSLDASKLFSDMFSNRLDKAANARALYQQAFQLWYGSGGPVNTPAPLTPPRGGGGGGQVRYQ